MSITAPLDRRTFLRGAGAMVSLPMLDAMMPLGAGAEPPRRLIFVFFPSGVDRAAWEPQTSGPGFELSESLQPLAPVRQWVSVLSGLHNHAADPRPTDGLGDHQRGTASFLTATHIHPGQRVQNAVSADQLAAAHLAGKTRVPSLQLGVEGNLGTEVCVPVYACDYARSISWADAYTPLGQQTNPSIVFDHLLTDPDSGATPELIAKRRLYDQSILDFVRDDIYALHQKVGAADRLRLDQHLTGLRDLERRIHADAAPACVAQRPMPALHFAGRLQQMFDLIALAFRCDLTRVVSLMLGNGGSNLEYSFAGAPGYHHNDFSHHEGDPGRLSSLRQVNAWHVGQLASLIGRLATVEEDGESLMNRTLLVYGSDVSDPHQHNHDEMPVLLAGRAPGTIEPGRHVRYPAGTPFGNLLISMLASVGVGLTSFGEDGDDPLAHLGP